MEPAPISSISSQTPNSSHPQDHPDSDISIESQSPPKRWKPSHEVNQADRSLKTECGNFADFKQQIRNLANDIEYLDQVEALSIVSELVQNFSKSLESNYVRQPKSKTAKLLHPLENEYILENIMSHGTCTDFLNWRQVSKCWNCIATKQLLKSKWVSLKNTPTLDYPFYRNTSISEFVKIITSDSLLYPLKKFSLKLFPIRQPQHEASGEQDQSNITIMDSRFIKSYFNFMTHLKIHYVFVEHFEENIPSKDINDSMSFLQPKYLPNLEFLSLKLYPIQLFAPIQKEGHNDEISSSSTTFKKFKSLELEVLSIGTREVEDRIFISHCFFYAFLESCPLLESFKLTANRGRISVMQQAMNLLYTLFMKHLKHLSFCSSARGSKIDMSTRRYGIGWMGGSSPFQLKSFNLTNVVPTSLHEFLREHAMSLIELRINCGIILHTEDSDEFDQVLHEIPSFMRVGSLELNYYPRSEMALGFLLSRKYFPKLQQLKIKLINASNWIVNDETSNIEDLVHGQVEELDLDISDGLLTGKSTFLQQFVQLQSLKLCCKYSSFLHLLTPRSMSQTLTQLSLQIQDKNSGSPWDTILTGIHSTDVHIVLDHIRFQYQKYHDDFDVSKYSFDKSLEGCKESHGASIEYLQNLQKFELQYSGSERLRITEITLMFLLKKFKILTAVHIQNCCIPNEFAKKIRASLSPSIVLDVEGIKPDGPESKIVHPFGGFVYLNL